MTVEVVSYELIQITEQIRVVAKKTLLNVIELGKLFTMAKEVCRREKVSFMDWYGSEEVRFSARSVSNYMRLYETSKLVNFTSLDIDPSAAFVMIESTSPESAIDELLRRAERGERITYSTAVEVIDRAKHVEGRDAAALGTPLDDDEGINPIYGSSESNEWYTPAEYVEMVRKCLGSIDLDPASCEYANEIVKAEKYYTLTDDGLDREWFGRVFVNPPYGRVEERDFASNQALWSARFCDSIQRREIDAGILLVSTSTSERWFAPLFDHIMCLTDHRIRFYRRDGEKSSPVTGSAFIYYGDDEEAFIDCFSRFGPIIRRIG